jgi:hypothetical protein
MCWLQSGTNKKYGWLDRKVSLKRVETTWKFSTQLLNITIDYDIGIL